MKRSPVVLALAAAVASALVGCSTPDSRVSKNSALVSTWSPDVQAKVREGKVDIGFTSEQVRVALGDPDRTFLRAEAQGSREVWVYFDHGPKFSIGVGVGGGGGNTRVGGGVGVSNAGRGDPELMRVIFEAGRVFAIEQIKK